MSPATTSEVRLPLLDLIDGRDDVQPIVQPDYSKEESHLQRFAKFHHANPHVYGLICKLARHVRSRGFAQFGIGAIFEQLRWFYIETHGDKYRLNHNLRAYYARLVMAQESDLAGFFETRQSPHDPTYYEREARA